ncbi:MAG: response regulator [Candidatus Aenigmarchaeota archaeon]|nr:response regulator [Candidatus Aenigmarchaeota archaeon]
MTRILVVDDEPDTVDLVKSIMEGAGYKVETAYNGKECLAKVKKEKVDIVLLDIMMPDMSGWDVFGKIMKSKKKMKVAFISIIEVSPERKDALMKQGLKDYIMKPFTKDELLKRIKKMI